MIKNDKFYIGKGTKRLLEEFRAVAGCRTTEQAVDAIFMVAATMTGDYLADVKYCAKEDGAPAWSLRDSIEKNLFSPQFSKLTKQRGVNEIPMTAVNFVLLCHMEAQADKISGLDVTYADAFTLAVMMAKDVHDKFGNGQIIKIPVDKRLGNPLYERHIHLAQ